MSETMQWKLEAPTAPFFQLPCYPQVGATLMQNPMAHLTLVRVKTMQLTKLQAQDNKLPIWRLGRGAKGELSAYSYH